MFCIGGYYSYSYAKCFASAIWERVCKEDPLSLETGAAIRTKFLQHGGAKDRAQLMILLVMELQGATKIMDMEEV